MMLDVRLISLLLVVCLARTIVGSVGVNQVRIFFHFFMTMFTSRTTKADSHSKNTLTKMKSTKSTVQISQICSSVSKVKSKRVSEPKRKKQPSRRS